MQLESVQACTWSLNLEAFIFPYLAAGMHVVKKYPVLFQAYSAT